MFQTPSSLPSTFTTTMAISDHSVLTFKQVQVALNQTLNHHGFPVESDGPLVEALGQLGCFPYVRIPFDSFDLNCELRIADKPAGTFEKPDVDLILQECTPSSFGKGDKTVLDPAYRSGKEISAQKMEVISESSYRYFCYISEDEIAAAMFAGKTVKLKFYKLAVYEEGGHFDWHMDTTHSDQHHATLLLALNTSWEGGDLKLRRKGMETIVDMHPKANKEGGDIKLQVIAFYTDTEHKVEPVTKGIRIVLQYDVEVVGSADKEDDECDRIDEVFLNIQDISRKRKRYQKSSDSLSVDDAIVTKVTSIIENLLADEEEVGFALQHLYRKSSILPEFLKGADAQLYHALVRSFDVTLRPVILQSFCDDEGFINSFVAIPWDDNIGEYDSDSASDDESSSNKYGIASKSLETEKELQMTFHLPTISAIRQISYQEYVEYTGNSAQAEEKKYFGGGMFVRKKVAKE